jgi:predicted HAD superfamily Cof-like phosphohydrolase
MQNKKQLFNLVEDIYTLNRKQWDNQPGTYNPELAASLLIEEALELLNDISPKDNAREIVAVSKMRSGADSVAPVNSFDGLLDSLYITIGELNKLGVTPHQLVDGLQIVHNANKQKSGTKDSNGKVIKPSDESFVPPEEALQRILDN